MPEKQTKAGLILVAFLSVYLFWGGTYLGMKIGLESFPPFFMAAFRHLSAGIIMLSIALLKKEVKPTKAELLNASLVGILLLLMGNGLVAWSEQRLPSAIASLVITSVPFWVMTMNWISGDKKKPSKLELFSLFFGFLGILIMVFQGSEESSLSLDPIGLSVLMIAAFSWSLGSLYSRHKAVPKSSLYSTAIQMLAGGSSLLIVTFILNEPSQVAWSTISMRSWMAMVYLIVFGSVIAYTAYIWLMKNVNPTLASTYAFVNPVVAVFLGFWLAHESFSTQTLIAATIIIASVMILTLAKKPNKK